MRIRMKIMRTKKMGPELLQQQQQWLYQIVWMVDDGDSRKIDLKLVAKCMISSNIYISSHTYIHVYIIGITLHYVICVTI